MFDKEVERSSLDELLNSVAYSDLATGTYVPSRFSIMFMEFIKLVNGAEGESHKTPPIHLKMLDKISGDKQLIVNLCWRGAAKTTLFFEYMIFFLAICENLPGLGDVSGMMYVTDSMDNGVASARKNIEHRYYASEFLQYWLPEKGVKFTEKYIELTNRNGHKLGCRMYGAKTGIRGTKIFGKRPVLAILDDLLKDEDARSETSMNSIKDTIYKGVMFALDPSRFRVFFNGTPFNAQDPIIEAVESGVWDVNVWPVCEKFPCTKEEFVSAWPDRFPYEYVKTQYEIAEGRGGVSSFMQELMLRISSEEERLVQDGEIRWYNRQILLENKHQFHFYITTDFATTDGQHSDFSVISVWAYNHNGDWFWVDGMADKKLMDYNIDKLFSLVQQYEPLSVGIESSGQQGGFIQWIEREMISRNIHFNLASSEKSGKPGIRPLTNKLARFNLVVPLFKAGKIKFPSELKDTVVMNRFLGQIRLATITGLKGKDDCIDTISMLAAMPTYKPSKTDIVERQDDAGIWEMVMPDINLDSLSSYIV